MGEIQTVLDPESLCTRVPLNSNRNKSSLKVLRHLKQFSSVEYFIKATRFCKNYLFSLFPIRMYGFSFLNNERSYHKKTNKYSKLVIKRHNLNNNRIAAALYSFYSFS